MLKVGDKIWHFDENRRQYAAMNLGAPIWIKHWHEVTITGENRVSWLTNHYDYKVNKRALASGQAVAWVRTFSEVQDREWDHVHRHKILDRLRHTPLPIDELKRLATLVGYKP